MRRVGAESEVCTAVVDPVHHFWNPFLRKPKKSRQELMPSTTSRTQELSELTAYSMHVLTNLIPESRCRSPHVTPDVLVGDRNVDAFLFSVVGVRNSFPRGCNVGPPQT